jgi:type I restriction enzyme, R subunit
MTTQSEHILEETLITQLIQGGYERITLKDEAAMLRNLKTQLEKHNQKTFSDNDFKKILNHLTRSTNVFDKAKLLRDKFSFKNNAGEAIYLEFLNMDFWCQNQYQVCSQVSMQGRYENRYDVTLLINGLPLVQIELKRRGADLKVAYNQVRRYQRDSFASSQGLFQFVQLFVISTGVETKYFAHDPGKMHTWKQTFYWTNDQNKRYNNLEEFAGVFLEKCHLSKMITRYTVLHETGKALMVMRPYQVYAVERIVDRVSRGSGNGYVWHTTGSGKTLTSFKASQILTRLPQVDKVVFCVDRRDLDYQTIKEFNEFAPDSVDATTSTRNLVKQFTDPNRKLIVTTLQKLHMAISRERHQKLMDELKNKKIVFIFDECHRSQFGETHKNIKKYFSNYQMFGFTGTPIKAENAQGPSYNKQTTISLFQEELHNYVIADAIRDQSVLPFSVEYVGRYRAKDSRNEIDIEVEAIDTKELMESPDRLKKITDYILAQHTTKTHHKEYSAMFCISNIDTLIKYYDIFLRLREEGRHNLSIATIFSYGINDDDKEDFAGMDYEEDFNLVAEPVSSYGPSHRDKLEAYIEDYNRQFGTRYSTKDSASFYEYYQNVSKRTKNKEIDILFVVNMFLTGFDSKFLNTLYVDKNLKHHGLIQAYSRTNRVLGEKKSQGNIVVFRNLKKATDDAVALFSDKRASDVIFVQPLEVLVQRFRKAHQELIAITPTVASVDDLYSEDEELAFVLAFRKILRLINAMRTYADFNFGLLPMDEQTFMDFSSRYFSLNAKAKSGTESAKASIIDEVDFELELLHQDHINVVYILGLLAKLKKAKAEEYERMKSQILQVLSSNPQLHSKRELIEKFINENLPLIDEDNIESEFDRFMSEEKQAAFYKWVQQQGLNADVMQSLIEEYIFTQRLPNRQALIAALSEQPSVLKRKELGDRLLEQFTFYVERFFEE